MISLYELLRDLSAAAVQSPSSSSPRTGIVLRGYPRGSLKPPILFSYFLMSKLALSICPSFLGYLVVHTGQNMKKSSPSS